MTSGNHSFRRASKITGGSPGFTFIEVLVAMTIFVLAAIAAVNLARGSTRAIQDSKEVSQATWLLQQKMVELETSLETNGIEKACEEKNTGKFDEPHSQYRWVTKCNEIDFHLAETASLLTQSSEEEQDSSSDRSQKDQITKMVIQLASDYLNKSVREIHTEVHWKQQSVDRTVAVTTHFATYNTPVGLPGAGQPAGDGTGGNPQ